MTNRERAQVMRICGVVALFAAACGSNDNGSNISDPNGGSAGTAGSSGADAGSGPAGSSGSAGTTSAGGTPSAGSAGTEGGAAGTPSAGSAGTAQAGAGAGGAAGTSSAGAAGSDMAGSSGVAGSAGAGGAGTAVFDIDITLASEVDPAAPGTVGIVTWSVDVATLVAARIEFGLDTSYGMTAPVDLAAADYRTLLLGMKPARTYHVRVVAEDASATYTSEDLTVETGPATQLVPLESFDVVDDSARERGFIVGSYWMGMGSTVPFILDADGEVVWWFEDGPNGIARAVMSADGKNMWLTPASNSGGPLVRVSMDTLDSETYSDVVASHDITPVSGETMAYIEYGESDCDSIFEIDPSGTTQEIFESQGVVEASGCHGNALRYSKAEDVYTFSDVSQDILVIDRQGDVVWRLSERTDQGNAAWGGTQHGHHLLASSMLVYANRGGGSEISSFIEFSLEGAELRRYESGAFSANLGDVQRLPGGNTLITFSNDSLIHEIDAQDNLVLEINGGGSRFGYSLFRSTLYGEPPDINQ